MKNCLAPIKRFLKKVIVHELSLALQGEMQSFTFVYDTDLKGESDII